MNIRKSIDYSQMYQAIDKVMAKERSQMQMYCEIGKIVCTRSEKGAAVMASEYIRANHPEVQGFSPRNLRRMRDFYRTYENHPVLLSLAMELCWTQNVVIMEADMTMEIRKWYLRAARRFGWSKADLINKIAEHAHLTIVLDHEQTSCVISENNGVGKMAVISTNALNLPRLLIQRLVLQRCRGRPGGAFGLYPSRIRLQHWCN